MIKLNLCIDGNYALYRSVFILHRLKTLYVDLETLLLNDYNNIVNAFPFAIIYYVSDSKKSWRKILYPEYKGKRKKEEKIDWDFVFDVFDKFKENIKRRHNCLLYQIEPFEGDDIIAHIMRETNKEGYSNLIISNDSDLHQLLKFSTIDNYINLIYNHKFQDEKLFVPQNYNIFLKHIENTTKGDIFNLNDDIDFINYFDKLTSKAKIISINSEESYFKKLVSGDSGDNILSVVKFSQDIKGIGPVGSETVYHMYKEKFPQEIDFDSEDYSAAVSQARQKSQHTMAASQNGMTRPQITKYNMQLMGIIAEIACKEYLEKIIRDIKSTNSWKVLRYDEIRTDEFKSPENEYDLKIQQVAEPEEEIYVESRSSITYDRSFQEGLEKYDIIGPYTSIAKSSEDDNDIYLLNNPLLENRTPTRFSPIVRMGLTIGLSTRH